MYLVRSAWSSGEREFVILLGMYVCVCLIGYVCMHVSCCHCWVSWRERVRDLVARGGELAKERRERGARGVDRDVRVRGGTQRVSHVLSMHAYTLYVCMCVCMYVCIYVCMYVCMYICMYVCMYVCMHLCMYV